MTLPAGAILAGGMASRYGGTAKGLLEARPGLTIIGALIDEMMGAGLSSVVISADDPEPYRRFGLDVVPDQRPGLGPLGGIQAALAHCDGRSDAVLFCPCDLPGMTRREISTLIEAHGDAPGGLVVAETRGFFWHPLCCVVHNALNCGISEAIDAGERGVGRLWHTLGATVVHFADESPFFNVNSPEDLAEWRSRGGRQCDGDHRRS